MRFPSGAQAWFGELADVHAPEIVQVGQQDYIARVSGPGHANPNSPAQGGWIEVARLDFAVAGQSAGLPQAGSG
jgi:hypothetical protein